MKYRQLKKWVLGIALLTCLQAPAMAISDQVTDAQMDESLIRAAREQFNLAIEQQNVDAIVSFLLPSYHIITGRSVQEHGKEAESRSWAELFASDPSFVCRRSPEDIKINSPWGLAQEIGNWVCSYTVAGEAASSEGVYSAKWQRVENGTWLLQSEVFTTLACRGNEQGCRPPDPVIIESSP